MDKFCKQCNKKLDKRNQGGYCQPCRLRYFNPLFDPMVRQKISEAHKGEKNHCFGKPAYNRGQKMSLVACQKMSLAKKGKKLSTAHKIAISQANKGKKKPPRTETHLAALRRAGFKSGLIPWNKGLTKETSDSLAMVAQNRIGMEFTEEHKKKLSLAKLGKPCSRKGHNKYNDLGYLKVSEYMRNRIVSKETREKSSKARLGKSTKKLGMRMFPESHYDYSADFNRSLKKAIWTRDEYCCQTCYKKINDRHEIATHHIDYNKKNNSTDNLITLCKSCHSMTNYGREFWKRTFQSGQCVIKEFLYV